MIQKNVNVIISLLIVQNVVRNYAQKRLQKAKVNGLVWNPSHLDFKAACLDNLEHHDLADSGTNSTFERYVKVI